MFYLTEIEDYVRVEPRLFGLSTDKAVEEQLLKTYENYVDKEIGNVISVVEVLEVGDGIIIPGDGAAYYNSKFKLLCWKPEMGELVYGDITEITNFGAFINLGGMQGMIHISQAMDDYVNFSKTNTLLGKNTKRNLKKGDSCLARIVAVSYKAGEPKIGLTMRQPGLGCLTWIEEDKKKAERAAKAVAKKEDAEVKGKKKKEKK